MQRPIELRHSDNQNLKDKTQKTYICDLWRGGFEGVLSSGAQTFCLFIAIRFFTREILPKH